MTIIARRLTIRGKVQRVWFRAWTVETARELGLSGWVRNRIDGAVETLVQGDETAVEHFTKLAWHGPSAAKVTQVEIDPDAPTDLNGFQQRPTA